MTKERRRTERLASQLFITIIPRNVSDEFRGRGVVVDVSHLGLAVETEAELDMGEVYDCQVELPYPIQARVVRGYKTGVVKRYGLEIIGQGFMDKLVLKKLLKGRRRTKKI